MPDHRTISDFRKDNLTEIRNYFVEIIRLINKLGITEIGKLYIDSTKIKASASSKRTKDIAGFEKWLTQIEDEVTELLKVTELIDDQEDAKYKTDEEQEAIKKRLSNREYLKGEIKAALEQMKAEDKKRINLTDADANYMKSGGSKDIRPSYSCQTSVTEDGVIVAAEAVTEASDMNQLQPMIEQSTQNSNELVKEVAADSGYGNYENYEYLESKGIEGHVPDIYFHEYKRGNYEKDRYHYSNFVYDKGEDSYTCPEGKKLKYWKSRKNKTKDRQWNHKVYKGMECGACESRAYLYSGI